ncbi:MAG TPA: pitrilysin family protein [bacterium]|nr:pitrilysin family protein [bacterium]
MENRGAVNAKFRSLRTAAFFLALGFIILAATASFASAPKINFPPLHLKIPRADTLTFANGLHGYLMEDHEIPVVTVMIRFKIGYAPEDKTGLNELASWSIRNGGSKSFPKDTLDDELEFLGASIESAPRMGRMFGGMGLSSQNLGQISANFLTKDMDRVMEMFADLIINPAFAPDQIELQKKSMIEDIRRRADDPSELGRREFSKIIYRGNPAGREATVATVTNITRDDVMAFFSKYVRPNNAVIGISGDIDREQAMAEINKYLAGWQPGGETPVVPEMKYEATPSINYIYKDVNQAYIWIGHMGMNDANPDVPIAEIMNHILGGGSFTSWITQNVRSNEGLAYSAGSRFGTRPWGYGLFTASCQTRSDAAMRALGLVIDQIKKMATQGPTDAEVKAARDSYINTQVFDYESSANLIDRLTWYDITGLPLDSLEREFKTYQATTLADVNRVAKQYLHPEDLTILVIGNKDLFDRPLSDLGQVNVIEVKQEEVPAQ